MEYLLAMYIYNNHARYIFVKYASKGFQDFRQKQTSIGYKQLHIRHVVQSLSCHQCISQNEDSRTVLRSPETWTQIFLASTKRLTRISPRASFHLTFAGHLKPSGASPPLIRAAPARCGLRQVEGGGVPGGFFGDAAAGDIGKSWCRSLSWWGFFYVQKKVHVVMLSFWMQNFCIYFLHVF